MLRLSSKILVLSYLLLSSSLLWANSFTIQGRNYEIVKKIGQGGSGKVYLVESNGEQLVAKFSDSGEVLGNSENPETFFKEFLSNHKGQQGIHESRYVGAIQMTDNPGFDKNVRYFVELNVLRGRNLFRYSTDNTLLWGDESPAEVERKLENSLRVVEDLLVGLSLLHKKGYMHRDIKPLNILIDKNGRAEITDWGLILNTRFSGTKVSKKGIVGTRAFIDPAVINSGHYSFLNDYYALGSIIFGMLTGYDSALTSISTSGNSSTKHRPVEIRDLLSASSDYEKYFEDINISMEETAKALNIDSENLSPRSKQIYKVLRELALIFLSPNKSRIFNVGHSPVGSKLFRWRSRSINKSPTFFLEYKNNLPALTQPFESAFPRVEKQRKPIPPCKQIKVEVDLSGELTGDFLGKTKLEPTTK